VLVPPTEDILIKSLAQGGALETPIKSVSILGCSESIIWKQTKEGLRIQLPHTLPDVLAVGFKIES
jgi:alpha-L-fucosidase